MEVRKITKADWSEVREIYQLGIDTGVATFETSPPIEFETWINKIDKENGFVCTKDSEILGWATLTKVSSSSPPPHTVGHFLGSGGVFGNLKNFISFDCSP